VNELESSQQLVKEELVVFWGEVIIGLYHLKHSTTQHTTSHHCMPQ
jgi:hypothetical protein